MNTGRRAFLITSVVAAAGGLAVTVRRCGGGSRTLLIHRIFARPHFAQRIGEAYLEQVPEEADPEMLLELIYRGRDWEPGFRGNLRSLREYIREDFDRADILEVRGWELARTEWRVFALASLTYPGEVIARSRADEAAAREAARKEREAAPSQEPARGR